MKFLPLTDEDIGKIMRKARDDAIEECAQAVENRAGLYAQQFCGQLAAAIRALKDKP